MTIQSALTAAAVAGTLLMNVVSAGPTSAPDDLVRHHGQRQAGASSPTTATTAPLVFTQKTLSTNANTLLSAFGFESTDYFLNDDDIIGWNDPTSGYVVYVSTNTDNLVKSVSPTGVRVNTGAMSSWTDGDGVKHAGIKAVRLQSKASYGVGTVLIADVRHVPSEIGTWPALWLVQDEATWPNSGEFDLIEGWTYPSTWSTDQPMQSAVFSTLHTAPNVCTVPNPYGRPLNCNAGAGDEGCPFDGPANTFGAALNAKGGGTFAMAWTSAGIRAFFWPRATVKPWGSGAPASRITVDSTWDSAQYASWPFSKGVDSKGRAYNCVDPKLSQKMRIILNTDICGDVFPSAKTCESYVKARYSSWTDSHWDIAFLATYTQSV